MNRKDLTGFAVDFGGTKVTAARIEDGEIAAMVTQPTDRSGNLQQQLDHIGRLLHEVGFAGTAKLGIAVTGLVSRTGHWSAVNARTLPAIRNEPLLQALRRRYEAVACCNDAAAATLAEFHFGAGRGCQDFAYVTVSTGVGGGLVLGETLITGGRGLAGHFGFAKTDIGQGACGSGRMGTVEAIASGQAIAQAAGELGHADVTAKDVFQLAAIGTGWAERLIETSAKSLAGLLADLAAIVDPEMVAIGGSIGLAPGYLDRVARHLGAEPAIFQLPVNVAQLGHDGPLLGALANVG